MKISEKYDRGSQVLNIILPDKSVLQTGSSSLSRHVCGDIITVDSYGRWHPQKIACELLNIVLDADACRYQAIRIFAFGHADQIAREFNSLAREEFERKLEIYSIAPIYDRRCVNHARLSDRIKLWQWKDRRQGRYSVRDYAKAIILPKNSRINVSWQMVYCLSFLFRFNDRKDRSKKLFFTGRSDIMEYLGVLRSLGALQRPFVYITLTKDR
ncbi:hypothetical protein IJG66_00340 [Candidatus Saccharibacteria bacterium]|nr:hypothetical protein [Candidatus Saccharibacteria bacterium]